MFKNRFKYEKGEKEKMKKKIGILLGIIALVIAAGGFYYFNNLRNVSVGIDPNIVNEDQKEGTTSLDPERTLVIYFSNGGNTQKLAKEISDQVGGDFRQIIPTVAYPEDDTLYDYAKAEQDNDERPEINELDIDMSQYDTIFLGYPIWWYTYPQIILTFFDEYDVSNKMIIPFVTHGGSGMSGTEEDMRNYLEGKNVTVRKGLSVSRNVIDQDQSETVSDWLSELGLK